MRCPYCNKIVIIDKPVFNDYGACASCGEASIVVDDNHLRKMTPEYFSALPEQQQHELTEFKDLVGIINKYDAKLVVHKWKKSHMY